ncbi:MAG TPA: hypothetical protein VFA83_08005 [Acidimicrobiales bacterium]|nr:hypothetical protein [Acidimicrobiales bacterium]
MAAQRRKRGGRVTPRGGSAARLSASEKRGLEEIFAELLRGVRRDLSEDAEPLLVEMWASHMWSIWQGQYLVEMDAVEVFAGGLIAYAATRNTPNALAVLRALASVAPEPYGARARRAADRVAGTGVVEPPWSALVGTAEPTVAWIHFDPVDDDGVSVMVEFEGLADVHTVGVYIDHNLGGIAKDAFAVPASIDSVLARLKENDEFDPVECRQISVAEAAARWREALEMTARTHEPPVSDDLRELRALLEARLRAMPLRGKAPAQARIREDDRESLLSEFLESDETIGLWGVDGDDGSHVEHLAMQAMTFSLDYVRGTPLRFSPVMVEMFCLDWAPRKIAADEDAFTMLPDVLAAWVRFAGRHRGIPEASITEAVKAAYEYAPEMIELARDPANWGAAKTIGLAVQERGIDITDQAALDDFITEVNRGGGIDVLANELAKQ